MNWVGVCWNFNVIITHGFKNIHHYTIINLIRKITMYQVASENIIIIKLYELIDSGIAPG